MNVLEDEPIDHVGEVGGEELDVPQLPVVVERTPTAVQHDRQHRRVVLVVVVDGNGSRLLH